MTVSEMVFEYLPMRPVTDQLIDRFFKGKEPAWRMYSHGALFLLIRPW